MFGSIKPIKDELKIREYDMFRSYYCGLCKKIGKRHNQIARLGLSYDFTFLVLILDSVINKNTLLKKSRCLLHPLEHGKIVDSDRVLDYASDLSILLSHAKLHDDWNDEKDIKAFIGYKAYSLFLKNIEYKYIENIKIFDLNLERLRELEIGKSNSIDSCAETFAEIMKCVFSPEWLDEKKSRILGQLGYELGRWIYIIDAVEDIKKDFESNLFNPFINKEKPNKQNIENIEIKVKKEIEDTLFFILGKISDAYELLEIYQNKGILDNIIYLGLRAKTEEVLKITKGENHAKSI